jgi:protein-S-isoprenylcysteine O-methyltransferase Ste14
VSPLEVGVALALFGGLIWALLSATRAHVPILEIGAALGLVCALIWALLSALYVAVFGLTPADLAHQPEYWIAFPGARLESQASFDAGWDLAGPNSPASLRRDYQTSASRAEVMAFYRQELLSRGWSVLESAPSQQFDTFDACARGLHFSASAGSATLVIWLSSLTSPGRTNETPACREGTPPAPEAVALMAVVAFTIYIARASLLQRRARRVRGGPLRAAGGVARWGPAFVFVPYLILDGRPGPTIAPSEPIVDIGLALVIVGAAFALWAASTLGAQFDLEPGVHQGHSVVRAGPYRVVRHPVYVGIAVHLVGACIASGNLALILGVLLVGFPLLYVRARAEEQLLRAELGPAYDVYSRDVGMFVPRLTRG